MNFVIAFGSNLGDRQQTIERALRLIAIRVGDIRGQSKFYETPPLINEADPVHDQRDYLNGVVLVSTEFGPREVLAELLAIEEELGRDRSPQAKKWGPRTIDLDIIAAEDLELEIDDLTIPHPEMHKRAFVLQPMGELCSEWQHPRLKRTVVEMLDALNYEFYCPV